MSRRVPAREEEDDSDEENSEMANALAVHNAARQQAPTFIHMSIMQFLSTFINRMFENRVSDAYAHGTLVSTLH